MIPVDEDVFQRVSWNCANPTNTDTQNRNVYFKSLKRMSQLLKIKNTETERNKSSGSCSTKPAWEGGIVKPEQRNPRLKIIQRTETDQVTIYFKSGNLTVISID